MKTRIFHILFLAVFLCGCGKDPNPERDTSDEKIPDRPGMTIKGWVHCNDAGVPGVVVSDGYGVTVTDGDGIYYLNSEKKYGFVFISIPANYEPDVVDNIPQFFRRLQQPAETVEQADFELTQVDNERYALLVIADPQLANRTNDLEQFNTSCLPEVNRLIGDFAAKGTKTYILTLGDLTWDAYWYSNNFGPTGFADLMKNFGTYLFNTMGNHDNDPYFAGDLAAEQTYQSVFGPKYYSFNLGRVHYVVLDNILYVNTGASSDTPVMGDRSYTDGVTADQIEWLKKDLAKVTDKSAPLIVAIHFPLYAQPDVGNIASIAMSGGQQLIDCLAGFSNVYVLSGHRHTNCRVNPASYPWLTEHNIGAINGTCWWTGNLNYAGNHICEDGSVGGYSVYEMNGKNIQWYYKSIGYDRTYQFRTYDLNTILITADKYAPEADASHAAMGPHYATPYNTENNRNEVLINVWGYDKDWTVEATEEGVPLAVTRVSAKDPLHIISYEFKRLNRNSNPTSSFVSGNTSHFFRVTASTPTSTLQIKVTDRFGNVYTETMTRPKELKTDME